MSFIVPEEIEAYAERRTRRRRRSCSPSWPRRRRRRCARRRCSPARSRAGCSSCSCTGSRPGGCSSSAPTAVTRRSRWRRACRRAAGSTPARSTRPTPRSRAATSPGASTPTGSPSTSGRRSTRSSSLDGRVRLRLHRRRQGELRQLLRGRPAEAGRRRPDRRRQHPLERPRPRRGRRLRGHTRDQGLQRACPETIHV